jgi:hypothetical protein
MDDLPEDDPHHAKPPRRRRRERPRVEQPDLFPLAEETRSPLELPTVDEWVRAGAPMREVDPKPELVQRRM